ALDQEALAIAALRRAGNFSAVPQQVELLAGGAGKASAGKFPAAARGQLGRDVESGECVAHPFMDHAITFPGPQRMPPVTGRENEAVSPVRFMRYEAAARGPPHQWAQHRPPGDGGIVLRVTE